MKFKKIDDYTVQCILSEEEIKQEGLELDDFFENRSKVRDFLEKLVVKASEEVGYHMHGNAIVMQISPAFDGHISITFSEKSEEGLLKMIEKVKDLLSEQGDDIVSELLKSLSVNSGGEQAMNRLMEKVFSLEEKQKSKKGEKKEEKKEETPAEKKSDLAVFLFHDWSSLEGYCTLLPASPMIKSWLYKGNDGNYYLVLEQAQISLKDFQKLCVQASEYGEYLSDSQSKKAYLKEHCQVMMKKKAVDMIQSIV